jgi:Tfp pilus assembly ATPase PilU
MGVSVIVVSETGSGKSSSNKLMILFRKREKFVGLFGDNIFT